MPSVAVDIAPYPIDWNNIERFAQLGGIIKGIAHTKGVKIRCGFDWDCDGDITDHSFMDWPHIELVDDEYIITNSNGYSIAMSESALEELMEIALLSVFEE